MLADSRDSGMTQLAPKRFSRPGRPGLILRPAYRIGDIIPGQTSPNATVNTRSVLEDPALGMTKYDLQTNSSCQNRIYFTPTGPSVQHSPCRTSRFRLIAAQDIIISTEPPGMRNRRTGWRRSVPVGLRMPRSDQRRDRGLPPFATYPLRILTRETKGTGAWAETTLDLPDRSGRHRLARMVTNGPDHRNIHIIALTPPTASGGMVYQGMDGAIGLQPIPGWRHLVGRMADP